VQRLDDEGDSAHISLAMFYASRGEHALAARYYQKVRFPLHAPHVVALLAYSETGRAGALLGDEEGAKLAYEQLHPWAAHFVAPGGGLTLLGGSVRLALGCTAAALGKADIAIGHLQEAVEANHRAGLPPFEAEASYELAKVLASRGDRGRSQALVVASQTAEFAAKLGMRPLQLRAENWPTRCGLLRVAAEARCSPDARRRLPRSLPKVSPIAKSPTSSISPSEPPKTTCSTY
jgi:tetratricopeptide (TPR) repeat protein